MQEELLYKETFYESAQRKEFWDGFRDGVQAPFRFPTRLQVNISAKYDADQSYDLACDMKSPEIFHKHLARYNGLYAGEILSLGIGIAVLLFSPGYVKSEASKAILEINALDLGIAIYKSFVK